MIPLLLIFTIAAGATLSDSAADDPIGRAGDLFTAGQFQEGLTVIREALAQDGLSRERRALLLERKARFYEVDVGNTDVADRLREEILNLGLPDEHPAAIAARAGLTRRETSRRQYHAQDSLLTRMRIAPQTLSGLPARQKGDRVTQLRRLISDHPGYPHRGVAWFYLGENLRELGAYREAVRAYQHALDEKPALGFYLPVVQRRNLARHDYQRQTAHRVGWGGLAVLVCLTAALFYGTRPWQWLRFRHGLALAALALLWLAFFACATQWASARVVPPRSGVPQPIFLFTGMGAPGSAPLSALFWYGLAGILGLFAIAAGTARLHLAWTRAFLNATIVLALFACLMTIFWLRHGDGQERFESAPGDRLPLVQGTFYCVISAIEPYVLTDPLTYPDLDLTRAEAPFAQWVTGIRASAGRARAGDRGSDPAAPPDSAAAGTLK